MPCAEARPKFSSVKPASMARLVIDMQHDCESPGGWANAMGLEVYLLEPSAPVVGMHGFSCSSATRIDAITNV